MVVNGLSRLMRNALEKNLFDGYKVGEKDCVISLLQYADDTIFIGEVSVKNVFTIKLYSECLSLLWG